MIQVLFYMYGAVLIHERYHGLKGLHVQATAHIEREGRPSSTFILRPSKSRTRRGSRLKSERFREHTGLAGLTNILSRSRAASWDVRVCLLPAVDSLAGSLTRLVKYRRGTIRSFNKHARKVWRKSKSYTNSGGNARRSKPYSVSALDSHTPVLTVVGPVAG